MNHRRRILHLSEVIGSTPSSVLHNRRPGVSLAGRVTTAGRALVSQSRPLGVSSATGISNTKAIRGPLGCVRRRGAAVTALSRFAALVLGGSEGAADATAGYLLREPFKVVHRKDTGRIGR